MRWEPLSASLVAYDGHPLEAALASLAGLGIQVVELAYIEGYSTAFDESVFSTANARSVRSALSQAGLTCRAVSAHFDLSRQGGGDALCRRLEFAAEVEAQMVATVSGPAARREAFLQHLAQASKLAEQTGITIALENPADDTDASINDGADAARVAAQLAHPLVRVNYDPGNFLTHRPGSAPHLDIEPALPYCIGVHLKDLRREGAGWVHTALGEGAILWDEMFHRLALSTVPPLLSIEIPTRMRRDGRGRIVLDSATLPLAEIEALLARSKQLVDAQIARLQAVQRTHS
jgi:sugar phosphate isomerase/epimerase